MTNNITNGLDGSHVDLSAQYGCRAFLTTVTFPVKGAMIRVRRFYRADMPSTGKLEIYTLEPRSEYSAHVVGAARPSGLVSWTFASEMFLRYARAEDQGTVDRLAHRFIAVAECTGGADGAARAELLELE